MIIHSVFFRAAIIGVGIASFVWARGSVERNRVEVMRSKRRVRDAVKRDSLEALDKAQHKGPNT